jgi:hypothetical protein
VGTLTGQIVYGGDPPALPPLFGAGADVRDAAVCAAEPIANESLVVDPATKGISHVFIYLEKAPKGGVSPPAEGDAIFDQRGCVFRPHALLIRAKQKVLILSDDPIAHNTHTFPNRNKPFNQGIPPNERNGVALTYAAAERMPVEVKCDYHPWMRAWHLPLDHGFAALTDAQGKFSIAGLPAGTHKFKIVHEGREIERAYSVTIKAGDNPLTITLGAEKFTAQGAPGKRLRITADGLVMR